MRHIAGGGADEYVSDAITRDCLTARKTKRIERKLHRLLPDFDYRAVASGKGCCGGSPNGMPTMGEIPGHPRCHAVMGHGGKGITFSMLATQRITAAILGVKLPQAAVFAFQ